MFVIISQTCLIYSLILKVMYEALMFAAPGMIVTYSLLPASWENGNEKTGSYDMNHSLQHEKVGCVTYGIII
jgi:hypothetical protein